MQLAYKKSREIRKRLANQAASSSNCCSVKGTSENRKPSSPVDKPNEEECSVLIEALLNQRDVELDIEIESQMSKNDHLEISMAMYLFKRVGDPIIHSFYHAKLCILA